MDGRVRLMEHFGSDHRYTSIVLFDVFQDALSDVITSDAYLFSETKNKAAVAHRLTEHMERRLRNKLSLMTENALPSFRGFPQNLVFDVMVDKADIILHDRAGKTAMTIMLYSDYISAKQAIRLKGMYAERRLTLAVAFLKGKPYQLIYRVDRETMDYYHYDSTMKTSMLRMQKIRTDKKEGQLTLLKPRARKQRARNTKQASQES